MQTLEHPCYNKLQNKVAHRSRVYADGRQHYCERCGEKIDQSTFSNIPQDYVTTHDAGDYNKPRPAAPVEGLETFGRVDETGDAFMLEHEFQNAVCFSKDNPFDVFTRELVTRSQAEAIIAAKDAHRIKVIRENERLLNSNIDLRRQVEKSDAIISDLRIAISLKDHGLRLLEADNAALTARVKELADERYKLAYAITGGEDAPGYLDSLSVETLVEVARDNARRWFVETDRAEALETQLAEAEEREKKAFKAGYVLACCNVVHQHDEPTIAHDALAELGVTKAEVKAMKLSKFDMKALRIIERDRSSSAYAKAKP